MRQVPKYVIIGNGRMARHMCYYFQNLAIDFHQWHRSSHSSFQLYGLLQQSTHALILINDNEIEDFIFQHIKCHSHLTVVHFSGCLVTELAFGVHPLQTFSQDLLTSIADYQKIPFLIDDFSPEFSSLLPGINNPYYRIKPEDKAFYHAHCVMANNFTSILWHKFYKEMTGRFSILPEHLAPYLEQTFKNLKINPLKALTGPLERKDTKTLQANMSALINDEFYSIYKAFFNQFTRRESNEKHP